MKPIEQPKFRFKKHTDIGASDAESDDKFLKQCFIDNGDVAELLDISSAKRIIVGRTGAGKSALIKHIQDHAHHVIPLNLEELSLTYVSNSDIIRFFEDAGVDLDVFYSLLWRHVFTVELLKHRFHLSEENQRPLMEYLSEIFKKDKRKEQAINYLKTWGEKFWKETEYRVKEFVQTLENALTEKAGVDFHGIQLSAENVKKLSEQVKGEVIHNAQKIVSEVQIKDLGKVIDLLADDIFVENKYPYYITIDKLDDSWANDRIRYKLIRALLETLRTFQRIPGVKIIVALRVDLLERVFEKTRNLGFQEEKYESLYLPLRWSEAQLRSLVDKRLDFLIRQQYTNKKVLIADIFPNKVNGQVAFDYMCARTFGRPRDIILFVNACIDLGEGKASIPAASIKEAEAEYSKKRLRSLADEWHADYPNLIRYSQIFLSRPSSFKFSEITSNDLDKFVVDHCSELSIDDPLYKTGAEFNEGSRSQNSFLIELIKILYRVGIAGIKPDAFNQTQWSFKEKASISDGQLKRSATIEIHPMFWRALGIIPVTKSGRNAKAPLS